MSEALLISFLICCLCAVSFMLGRCYEEWKQIPTPTQEQRK